MKREEIKSYKDACKVIDRKPRTYKDKSLNVYEQLTTIIAALNFISNNNKPWSSKYEYYYINSWACKEYRNNEIKKTFELYLYYDYSSLQEGGSPVGCSSITGYPLRIKEKEDGLYLIENFKKLLQDWFWS